MTVNPIPERAQGLRAQAAEEGGLCNIQIPAFAEDDTTSTYLDAVVASVTQSPDCIVDVCRSEGCHVCLDGEENVVCIPCAASDECDGLENVKEYRYCDCDAVVTVNEYNEFAMYTGKRDNTLFVHLLFFRLTAAIVQYLTKQMTVSQMTSS